MIDLQGHFQVRELCEIKLCEIKSIQNFGSSYSHEVKSDALNMKKFNQMLLI